MNVYKSLYPDNSRYYKCCMIYISTAQPLFSCSICDSFFSSFPISTLPHPSRNLCRGNVARVRKFNHSASFDFGISQWELQLVTRLWYSVRSYRCFQLPWNSGLYFLFSHHPLPPKRLFTSQRDVPKLAWRKNIAKLFWQFSGTKSSSLGPIWMCLEVRICWRHVQELLYGDRTPSD